MSLIANATMLDKILAGEFDRRDDPAGEQGLALHLLLSGNVPVYFDFSDAGRFLEAASDSGREIFGYRDFPDVSPPYPFLFAESVGKRGPQSTGSGGAVSTGGSSVGRFGAVVINARADTAFGRDIESLPVRPSGVTRVLRAWKGMEDAEREYGLFCEGDEEAVDAALIESRTFANTLLSDPSGEVLKSKENYDTVIDFIRRRAELLVDEKDDLAATIHPSGASGEDARRETELAISEIEAAMLFIGELSTYAEYNHFADPAQNSLQEISELIERYAAGTPRAPAHLSSVICLAQLKGSSLPTSPLGMVIHASDRRGRFVTSLTDLDEPSNLPAVWSMNGVVGKVDIGVKEDVCSAAWSIAASGIALTNCRNVNVKEVEPRHKDQKKHLKKHRTPLVTKRVLKLFPQETGRGSDGSGDRSGASQDTTALHLCRGHMKTYTAEAPLFGKYTGTYFWGPQVRGRSKNGRVEKAYALTPERAALGTGLTSQAQAPVAPPQPTPVPSPVPSPKQPGGTKVAKKYVSAKGKPHPDETEEIVLGMLREVS